MVNRLLKIEYSPLNPASMQCPEQLKAHHVGNTAVSGLLREDLCDQSDGCQGPLQARLHIGILTLPLPNTCGAGIDSALEHPASSST